MNDVGRPPLADQSYDHIIVGAGSAGCVLANRLSRDPAVRVLLLEAGGWDWNPLIWLPVGARELARRKLYEWGDLSEPDPGLDSRRMGIPHGKVIGGTSSINFMAHVRGHRADYEAWVERGASGWSYEEVLPFFKQCEAWERGEDAWRGGDGELGARAPRTADPIAPAFLEAARSLGYETSPDYNGETNEGFGPIQYSMRNGRRASSASAFLRPALGRPNLTVRTGAWVTKLVFEGAKVVGVEYRRKGKVRMARSTDRTVLCLGAINTPHLLMLSGVGPAEHLKSVGVRPIVDLPVGKNLEDHLGTLVYWTRKQPGTFHRSLRFDRIAMNMARAVLFGRGPASELPPAFVGFVKSRQDLRQPDLQIIIPTSAPNADTWFPGLKKPYVDGFMIRAQLLSQRSRGEVLLRSADPKDRPRVFYNSLAEPEDLQALREGVRLTLALGDSPALAPFRAEPVLPAGALKSDGEIDAFVRKTAIQLYHPASTCPMGGDERAVLNPDFSVRGVEGLYVVDASAMPKLVSGNPSVVIMMMAAKAAAMWERAA